MGLETVNVTTLYHMNSVQQDNILSIKDAVARKRKLFKFELRNVVRLEFNLWENIARNAYYNTILYYTILYYRARLGGLYTLALHVQ